MSNYNIVFNEGAQNFLLFRTVKTEPTPLKLQFYMCMHKNDFLNVLVKSEFVLENINKQNKQTAVNTLTFTFFITFFKTIFFFIIEM